MSARRADPARTKVTRLCLGLREAVERGPGQHAAFEVRGKKFAYYLDDHHGDGRRAVCCRAVPDERDALIASDPRRYFFPPYIGPRGWVGYYVDVGGEDWDEVRDLILESYRLAAPKRLAALVELTD
jgi:phosphoribosylglycinamide formyltransferase-1